jgi:hypothetical protein
MKYITRVVLTREKDIDEIADNMAEIMSELRNLGYRTIDTLYIKSRSAVIITAEKI